MGEQRETKPPRFDGHPFTASIVGTALVSGFLIFALLLAIQNVPLVSYIQSVGGQVQPLGSSSSSETLTALLYLIPTMVLTFVVAVGIKRNPRVWIKVLIGISFGVATFMVSFFSYWWWLGTIPSVVLLVSLVGPFVIGLGLKSGVQATILTAPYKIWLGVGIASLLFAIFPFTTALAVCGIVAVWDLYAVFRGPLKTISSSMIGEHTPPNSLALPVQDLTKVESQKRRRGNARFMLNTMMVNFGYGALGLGDITFYSLMMMLTLYFGGIFIFAGFVAILAGVLLTYYILKSGAIQALPGLPLPTLFFVLVEGCLYYRLYNYWPELITGGVGIALILLAVLPFRQDPEETILG